MFERLCSWPNLLSSYRRAARGKRGLGQVAAFEHRLEDNLLELSRELRNQSYRPGRYSSFFIHEPKRRLISAAPFRDRVVHHALCAVIEPVIEPSFVADSFANRKGKGTHRALDRCQVLAQKHEYVLQCDIRQFFPSIDHEILLAILARKISDGRTLWLAERILRSGAGVLDDIYEMVFFPGDVLFAVNRARGLPIGNLTSQFWANVYLSPFDHFVKRALRCPGYVRYVDDMLLFGDDKRTLWRWKTAVEARLAGLRTANHPGAHPRPVGEGIPFLGFVVYPDQRRLKRRKGIEYRRRVRRLQALYRTVGVGGAALEDSVRGWLNHVSYANTSALQDVLLEELPEEVRENIQAKKS